MTLTVRYAGFIRNVMIGRCGLTADRLIGVARDSGAGKPMSHLATGNLSFDADPSDIEAITLRIESGIAGVIERHEPIFVRSIGHLHHAVANDPFAYMALAEVRDRCVSYLQATPAKLGDLPVWTSRGDVEIFALDGLDVYSVTRLVNGYATSPGPILEKASGAPVTSRNWNTIEHVLAKQPSA